MSEERILLVYQGAGPLVGVALAQPLPVSSVVVCLLLCPPCQREGGRRREWGRLHWTMRSQTSDSVDPSGPHRTISERGEWGVETGRERGERGGGREGTEGKWRGMEERRA